MNVQGRYWLLTIPHHMFTPYLPNDCNWIRGQLECGHSTGFLHWQVVVGFKRSVRPAAVKKVFGDCHHEKTEGPAANDYVWKEDSRVAGTQFELGKQPVKRGVPKDWETIWESSKTGKIADIPADIRVRCYKTLKQIEKDHLTPLAMEREVIVYWGEAGTGKSRKAWEEAGLNAYPKDPCTKFWDAYVGQDHVVIDEFRGEINISHILRWFDRYPVNVECKFGATTLRAKKIWITSNLDPRDWYPDLNSATKDALLRRLNITHFNKL